MNAKPSRDCSLDEVWETAPVTTRVFRFSTVARRPDAARRYLQHAIAPGTPLASAVRLRMHGEIKVGRWLPFRAQQVLRSDGNMVWTATVKPFGLPLFRGFDRLVDGEGTKQWKLFGMIPIVAAKGSDTTRSTARRAQAESVWLPSMLCGHDVRWNGNDSSHATAIVAGYSSPVEFTIGGSGEPTVVRVECWGNPPPDTKTFQWVGFGGVMDAERMFAGYTIPTRVRLGWYVGTPQFDTIGECFRVTVDDATFR